MRALLAVALLIVGVLGVSTTSTTASFNDRVTTANVLAAAVLPPPTLAPVTVTGVGSAASVTLSWTPAASSFATDWQVLRADGPCGQPVNVIAIAAGLSFIDGPGTGTYCYAVRGRFASWLSAPSNSREVVIIQPLQTRYLHSSSGINALTPMPESTGQTIEIDAKPSGSPPQSVTWASEDDVSVSARTGWTVTLQTNKSTGTVQATRVAIDVWTGECSAVPPIDSPSYLAGISPTADNIPGNGSHVLALVPGTSASSPGTGRLCLRVANVIGNNSNNFDVLVVTSGGSSITGPLE